MGQESVLTETINVDLKSTFGYMNIANIAVNIYMVNKKEISNYSTAISILYPRCVSTLFDNNAASPHANRGNAY